MFSTKRLLKTICKGSKFGGFTAHVSLGPRFRHAWALRLIDFFSIKGAKVHVVWGRQIQRYVDQSLGLQMRLFFEFHVHGFFLLTGRMSAWCFIFAAQSILLFLGPKVSRTKN